MAFGLSLRGRLRLLDGLRPELSVGGALAPMFRGWFPRVGGSLGPMDYGIGSLAAKAAPTRVL